MKNLLLVFFLSLKVFAENQLDENQIEDLRQNIICYSIKSSKSDNYKDFYPEKGWQLDLRIYQVKKNIDIINENMFFMKL